jgi:hypothetical protein
MPSDQEEPADALHRLFLAYREACPDPEPDRDFMPQLWQKIDAQQSFAYSLKRLAVGIISAAAVASLAMGTYLLIPQHRTAPYYLEQLAASQSHDNLADTEIIQVLQENSR